MKDPIKNTTVKAGCAGRMLKWPVYWLSFVCIVILLAGTAGAGDISCGVAAYGGVTDHLFVADRDITHTGAGYGLSIDVPFKGKWQFVLHYRESWYRVDEDVMAREVSKDEGYDLGYWDLDYDIVFSYRQVIPCIRQKMVRYKGGYAYADAGLSFLSMLGDGYYHYTNEHSGAVDDGDYVIDEFYTRLYIGAGFTKRIAEHLDVLVCPSFNFGGFWDVSVGVHYTFVK